MTRRSVPTKGAVTPTMPNASESSLRVEMLGDWYDTYEPGVTYRQAIVYVCLLCRERIETCTCMEEGATIDVEHRDVEPGRLLPPPPAGDLVPQVPAVGVGDRPGVGGDGKGDQH
jgi:hypothetical protein